MDQPPGVLLIAFTYSGQLLLILTGNVLGFTDDTMAIFRAGAF